MITSAKDVYSFWKDKIPPVFDLDIETFCRENSDLAVDPRRNSIRLITIGDGQNTFIIDVLQETKEAILKVLFLIKDSAISGHNIKFDINTLGWKYGTDWYPKRAFCSMVAAQYLWFKDNQEAPLANAKEMTLKKVARRFVGADVDKSEQVSNWGAETLSESQLSYALSDVVVMKDLRETLIKIINSRSLQKLPAPDSLGILDTVFSIEAAYLPVLSRMELQGIPVNRERLQEHLILSEGLLYDFHIKCLREYNVEPTKPKKCLYVLQEKYKMPITSTGADILKPYRLEYPAVDAIITSREQKKQIDLMEAYLNASDNSEGLLYPAFNQQKASSGRMSAYSPNVQQIPKTVKETFYRNRKGLVTVGLDYPAIELRIVAAITQDPLMLKAIREGMDLHKLTASLIMDVSYDDVSKEQRQMAKPVNFGIIYGISAPALRLDAKINYKVEMSEEQSVMFIEKYLEKYVSISDWQQDIRQRLWRSNDWMTLGNGKKVRYIKISTMLGREVLVYDYRKGFNIPVQGTGADMIKLASVYFNNTIQENKLPYNLVSVVHDELVMEAPREKYEHATGVLAKCMEKAANSILKIFKTEVEIPKESLYVS